MTRSIVLAAVAASLTCVPAKAQERAGHSVAGVVVGAIILGPVGAVAGGLIGYTAGPEMTRGLAGEPPPRTRSKVRRSARSDNSTKRAVAPIPPTGPAVAARLPAAPAPDPAAPVAKAAPPIRATQPPPPVQSLE